ncbi:translation initiation factor IF-2-like [Anastrepha ludens]|uniref:translation initiation factor IF-2-like n=1 Tax=Anastrepha ludens TaxID=28586 RepID=UPI0023B11B52|nr:translation initiation factor IF-2-like [Anastrepha ludens]
MHRFICVFVSVLAVVNAAPYGGSGGYAAPRPAPAHREAIVHPVEKSVEYHIPAPSHWVSGSAAPAGPQVSPVNAYSISGSGMPSSLVGISSKPSAIASAASANVPLGGGSYKLLVVPCFKISDDAVGPEPAVHGRSHNGGNSGGNAGGNAYGSSGGY